jgi:hypothetical protein
MHIEQKSFPRHYWLEFNETLWELSIPRVDAHIIALLGSDILTQSYGP